MLIFVTCCFVTCVTCNLIFEFYKLDSYIMLCMRVAEWLRRLTHKPKVRTAVGSNPTLDSLVAVRNTSPGRPEPCEGNLVAVAGSCGGLMIKHPWPLLEISLSDFRGLATLNINTYLPTCQRYHCQIIQETMTKSIKFANLMPQFSSCNTGLVYKEFTGINFLINNS